jgi:hypothetical protein
MAGQMKRFSHAESSRYACKHPELQYRISCDIDHRQAALQQRIEQFSTLYGAARAQIFARVFRRVQLKLDQQCSCGMLRQTERNVAPCFEDRPRRVIVVHNVATGPLEHSMF